MKGKKLIPFLVIGTLVITAIAGLAAYSIQSHDQVLAAECLSKSLYPSSTAHLLTSLIQTGRTLLSVGEMNARYCWTFEAFRVYLAARADGIWLAVLVENNRQVQLPPVLSLLQDFTELQQV